MSDLYFYEKAGQQAGPLAGDQLIAQGVTASTLVWCEGMADWAAAESVPALRDFFAPPRPLPSPPATTGIAQSAKSTRPRRMPPSSAQSAFTGRNLLAGLVVLVAIGAEVVSRTTPDTVASETTEQQESAPVQEEEIKEIGYAANHLHEQEEVASDAPAEETPAAKPMQEDAIESVDKVDGWLTIHYEVGAPRSFGVEKDWFFAYSPHMIVTHNDRVSCEVRDIYGNHITTGSTLNHGEACTGLRVVGDHIIIDVDTGHSTRQETYDKKLNLVRRSNAQMY